MNSQSNNLNKIHSRKGRRGIQKGVIHIQASFNNTIITVTDILWSSANAYGFKGTRKSTPFTAQAAAENAIRASMDRGLKQAEVMMSGPIPGRDAALKAIRRSGVILNFVYDVTPMTYNGCRSPKKERL